MAVHKRTVENLINTTQTSKGWSDRPSASEHGPRSEDWDTSFNWAQFTSGDGAVALSDSDSLATFTVTSTGRFWQIRMRC